MILSAASVMSSAIHATTAVTTIASYDDLVSFVNSLGDYDYDGQTVNVTADITVNSGWTANDGNKTATAVPAVALDTTVATNAFKGTLNGNGRTISGLYINGVALLPTIENATVKNITFDNCYTNRAGDAAIVAGTLTADKSAEFINVTVSNSKIVNGTTNAKIGAILAISKSSAAGSYASDTTVTTCVMTDCSSIDNLIVSGAKTSLIGGLMGYSEKGAATFTRCYNSSELYTVITAANMANNGYKAGGILGYAGGNSTWVMKFVSCVNEGAVTASSIAGGIFGDGGSASATLESCVNTGAITAGDTVTHALSGKISYAGGLIGRLNGSYANVKECINTGDVKAVGITVPDPADPENKTVKPGTAGGMLGYANKAVNVCDFVNEGNVEAYLKAGGIVGEYTAKDGTLNRVITVGDIKGYNAGTSINPGSSCSLFGTWSNTNEDPSVYLTVKDFYYFNNNKNVFGLWQNLGTKKGNYHAAYTKDNKTVQVIGGVDNLASDGNTNNTQGKNLAIYNQFFIDNGYISNLSSVCGENGANKFVAFGLGEQWLLTDTVPAPASAYMLIKSNGSEIEDIEYIGYQKKLNSDTLEVRFVAELASTRYTNTGFEISAVEKLAEYTVENGTTTITMASPTCGAAALEGKVSSTVVYTSLKAFGEDGAELEPIVASEGKYLSAITLTSIPTEGTWTLVIKPYVTLSDGIGVVYGASYAMIVVDGSISCVYTM